MRSDTPDYEITSTVKPKHSIDMSIDMSSLGELFDVLSGLYSDPEYAVLRELATNARDSHIEAGVTRPIEITLPSDLEPNLVIQDFGLGMSRADIVSTYSKYGASTKRHSDDFNGTLGLGSKSPLTYTPQFTFIGIKDGVKTTVSVAKSETVPVMKVLTETQTDEGNGVKVIIPARSYNRFADKATHLFRFWSADSVLINGEAPTPIDGLKVTDDIMVTKETEGQDYIVMAGVPYPVNFAHTLVREHALVAFVPTGNVSFVPSREALKYNTKTKEAIAAILAEYEREITTAVQAQIENATSPRMAFQALADWRMALGSRSLSKSDFKYKGRVIPVEFAPKDEYLTISEPHSSKLSAHSRMKAVQIETVVNALCIYGYDHSFTPSHKKKLLKYVSDNNIEGVKHFVLAKSKLPMHWLDRARVVDWEIIRAIRLPRTGGQVSDPDRIKGSYDLYEQGDFVEGVPADDIDIANPIYYFNCTGYDKCDAGSRARLLTKYKRSYTMVILTSNRVDKFRRLFPKAKPVRQELERIYKRLAKTVTEDQLIAHAVQDDYYLKRMLKAMDISRVDDPAFAKMKTLMDADLSKSNLHKLREFHNVGVRDTTPEGQARTKRVDVDRPLDKYELISSSDFDYSTPSKLDHIYTYMNAAYATLLNSKETDSAV